MGAIPDEVVAEVRARVDLVKVVGERLRLHKVGSHWQGLCPFHGEKSPSFDVRPDRNTFKCFGCGEQGDAIAFIMKFDGLAFPDAVRALADDYGVAIPSEDTSAPRPRVKRPSALERRLSQVAEREAPNYAPALEVQALWDAAVSVLEATPVATWLREERHIDPEVVAELDLARVVAARAEDVPTWAANAVRKRYRVIVPLYDAFGVMRGFRFRPTGERYRALSAGPAPVAKSYTPEGHTPNGLIHANPLALDTLRRGSKAGAEYRAAMCCESIHTLVTEGELDYLFAAASEEAPVVFGVGDTWNDTHASAVQPGRLTLATDDDEPGDRYATKIRATLAHRSDVRVTRWRPHQPKQDFSDAGGLTGGVEHDDD